MAKQQKKQHPKKKLRVVGQNELSSGEKDGKAWTLYAVTADAEDGSRVEEKLKCFTDLAEQFGKLIEFGVEKQTHEKYGDSYLLHPPKRDMYKSLDELRERVSAIEHEVGELKKMIAQAPSSSSAPSSSGSESPATEKPLGERPPIGGQGSKESAAEAFGGDDDIPF